MFRPTSRNRITSGSRWPLSVLAVSMRCTIARKAAILSETTKGFPPPRKICFLGIGASLISTPCSVSTSCSSRNLWYGLKTCHGCRFFAMHETMY